MATGFSPERLPEGHTSDHWPAYWDTDEVTVVDDGPLVISGLGDGGLADFIRACGVEDREICKKLDEISRQLGRRVLRELEEFEEEIGVLRAILPDADLSPIITDRYRAALSRVRLASPKSLPDPTYLVGNGRHASPFRDGTYPGNRAVAIALIDTHQRAGRRCEFIPGPIDLTKPWREEGDARYPPATFATFPYASGGPRPTPFPCRAVLRNGPGVPPIERMVEKRSIQHLRERTAFFDLSLTERPLFPAPLRPRISSRPGATRLPPLSRSRRLRVYSEFYDSYIQRNLLAKLGAESTCETLFGRLRLQSLLFDEIVLTDAMLLDGEGFAEMAIRAPTKLAALLPSITVSARENTLELALLSFLGARSARRPATAEGIPELSLAPVNARLTLRNDLVAALAESTMWPVPTLGALADLLSGRAPEWVDVIEKWERLLAIFSAAPRGLWRRRIASPTPLTIPPRERGGDTSVIGHIAQRFRDSRTGVFAGLGPADELLDDPATASVVQWYNSAYNEAIAIRQKATVFESFWLPTAVVEVFENGSEMDTPTTPHFSYCGIGSCSAETWRAIADRLRADALGWRSGRIPLSTIIDEINQEIHTPERTAVRDALSFSSRVQAYTGQLQMREAAFTLQGGPGLRDVRCIMDWQEDTKIPLAATRLFGGAG